MYAVVRRSARAPGTRTATGSRLLRLLLLGAAMQPECTDHRPNKKRPRASSKRTADEYTRDARRFASRGGRVRRRDQMQMADGSRCAAHERSPVGHRASNRRAVALIRRLRDGALSFKGAKPCVSLLKLADFDDDFARLEIRTAIERT